MSTATMTADEATIEEFTIHDCEFDMEDFFATDEPEQPAAGPKEVTGTADVVGGDLVPAANTESTLTSENSTVEPVTAAGEEPMFSETAGEDWPVAGEGPSGVAPTDTPTKGIHQRIWECEHELGEACREEERLRSLVKSAKELRIDLTEQLEQLCMERDNPCPPDDPEKTREARSTLSVTTDGAFCSSPPQAWGREPIEVLGNHGLKTAKVEALRAAADAGKFGGDVAGLRDWIAKYDLWHRDVKGCGPKGADAITDALTKYVAANPMEEQPLTPEDEARHVAAAEFLGHMKPTPAAGEETSAPLGVFHAMNDAEVVATISTNQTESEEAGVELDDDHAPLASNVKPKRASKRKPKGTVEPELNQPIATPQGGYHEANVDALKRVEAIMSGKPDPGIRDEADDVSKTYTREQLDEAYGAGFEVAMAGESVAKNPHKRGTELWCEWDRGWQENNNSKA